MNHSDVPSEIGGSHPLGPWLNKLRRAVIRRTPLAQPGFELQQTESGFIQRPFNRIGAAPGPFEVQRISLNTLTFKLTAGYIVTTGDEFEPGNMTAEHTLAEGQVYYCYLDLTTTAATVVFATVRPTWSVNKIYVAKVTTTAPPAEGQPPGAAIRQILAENPQIPCA